MTDQKYDYEIKPDVMTVGDVTSMVPKLKGHEKAIERIFRFLMIDKVNQVHGRYHKTPGIPFSHALVDDEFKIRMRVDNEEILSRIPDGAFITVSNHPFGGLDGILLLHLVGTFRPDYKVMVNLILNKLSAMRPSFIAVDPSESTDPEKRKITMQGIREAITQVRNGHPIGFFPAGAVSKIQKNLHIRDREWQPSIIRLIWQMKVPVIPVYFHGHNSTFFNILGLISWKIRTLRLPAEVFNKRGAEIHISVGEPISVEEQQACGSSEALGEMLRQRTYALEKEK